LRGLPLILVRSIRCFHNVVNAPVSVLGTLFTVSLFAFVCLCSCPSTFDFTSTHSLKDHLLDRTTINRHSRKQPTRFTHWQDSWINSGDESKRCLPTCAACRLQAEEPVDETAWAYTSSWQQSPSSPSSSTPLYPQPTTTKEMRW
jgi:hypothetical protein